MRKKLIYLTSFVLVLGFAGRTPAGLVAHWTFDENSGTTVTDLVGGVVGNVTNATWTGGLFSGSGAALEFDGSSAYVNVPGEDWGRFNRCQFPCGLNLTRCRVHTIHCFTKTGPLAVFTSWCVAAV